MSSFTFKPIGMKEFIRIWNTDVEDGLSDSHPELFEDTPKEEWEPIYNKQIKVVHEAVLDDLSVGYVFLSPKGNKIAHLGYGIYQDFRGKGHSIQMIDEFMKWKLPNLDEKIDEVFATTLEDNVISQKVLLKLGFKAYGVIDDEEFVYVRYVKKIYD